MAAQFQHKTHIAITRNVDFGMCEIQELSDFIIYLLAQSESCTPIKNGVLIELNGNEALIERLHSQQTFKHYDRYHIIDHKDVVADILKENGIN